MIYRSSFHAYTGNLTYSSLYVILGIYDVSKLVTLKLFFQKNPFCL